MTVYSPLSPVSAGVYTALNVPALLALAPGGVHDDVPQGTTFPCVRFELSEEYAPAFGGHSGSGPGSMSRLRLRCSVYSQYAGMKEAQGIVAMLRQLIDGPLTPTIVATGYTVWAAFCQQTQPVGDEVLGGVKVKELVAEWTLEVEES